MLDQFANMLRSTRPFGGSLEVYVTPATNVTRGTSARILNTTIAPLFLNNDARANAGLGLKLGAQGYARMLIAPSLALLRRVSTSAALYGKGRFNDPPVAVDVGPEWIRPQGLLRVSAGAGLRYYGGAQYAQTPAVTADWLCEKGRRSQPTTGLSASRVRYPINALQEGATFDGTTSLERAITARTGGSVSVSLTRQTARDPGYAATSGGVGVSFRRLTLFGMAPILRVCFERNHSTVGLYDYRRLSAGIGMIRAF